MNVNFKTHFPWPGADGKPEETGFLEKIVAGLTRRHGDTELAPKLHTIRRVQTKPRFRAGMKLVLTTGGRFAPKPFCETECVSVQYLRMELLWVDPSWLEDGKGQAHGEVVINMTTDDGIPMYTLPDAKLRELAKNDGFTDIHLFLSWFYLDLITNGGGNYQIVHWTDLRY